ncbi:hypothetical protein [Streptomyces sp. ME19-01-6]|uniref:hypothetical protein n=1 Tax=Streptomyces sp. ME19-01-6 TaxID=3028686 RepID=UPI0029A7B157|nr:hypothetical protein [Streptomyces sp. ME19-01-6]MDX3228401.1 hypothetical protein [Streptomyces sp. ME19-01-6]
MSETQSEVIRGLRIVAAFTYTHLLEMDFGKLGSAVADWKTVVSDLEKLGTDVDRGLVRKSDAAKWAGLNATMTRDFVRRTAKEFRDLHREAKSIWSVLDDASTELRSIQRQVRKLAADARKETPGLVVKDSGDGSVRVSEALCNVEGDSQRTEDLLTWYAEAITDLITHAAEIDAAVTRALRASHGQDCHDAGHAVYTSLDEDMAPRAVELASLGDKASPEERARLRRLWESLSPRARGELWAAHKDGLVAAGVLAPRTRQISPDAGSGRHGVESPGFGERVTLEKAKALAEGASLMGMNDAARHLTHYLDNSGATLDLPVDKMMKGDDAFRNKTLEAIMDNEDKWRSQALAEFKRNGGRPVAIPVETAESGFRFNRSGDENWYLAVGSLSTNISGVVTVAPGAGGKPHIGLDYQLNAWDRYNWDSGKGTEIAGVTFTDEEMGRLHRTGLAQEFDVRGSSSVMHRQILDGPGSLKQDPLPDGPRDSGGRTDPGREDPYR